MNYDELLKNVRTKVDNLMEVIDSAQEMHEAGCTKEGKYSDIERFQTFYSPRHWTHSFLMGMAALLYYHYKEQKYLDYLNNAKKIYWNYLSSEKHMVAHDAGFLYSLYAVALYKLTGDKDARIMAFRAADELGKRYQFNPRVMEAFGDVREKGYEDGVVLTIVDDMMNMCLLMWAYAETGHTFYKQVYQNHIETAMQYLIRDDFSVRHAYHFSNRTGRPICEMNYCGYSVGSYWARGTAWMIYGLTQIARFTNDEKTYTQALTGVVSKYISELQGDVVPAWDFRAPKDKSIIKDSSAAVIAGCAFCDLDELKLPNNLSEHAVQLSDEILKRVSENLADNSEENIINGGQCGENELGCLWGDYFYLELLMKKIHGKDLPSFWIKL